MWKQRQNYHGFKDTRYTRRSRRLEEIIHQLHYQGVSKFMINKITFCIKSYRFTGRFRRRRPSNVSSHGCNAQTTLRNRNNTTIRDKHRYPTQAGTLCIRRFYHARLINDNTRQRKKSQRAFISPTEVYHAHIQQFVMNIFSRLFSYGSFLASTRSNWPIKSLITATDSPNFSCNARMWV